MFNLKPNYRAPADWVILEEQTIHDFNEEKPISVVAALVGSLHYDVDDFFGKNTHYRTPIIQWMTKQNFYEQQEVL